MTYAPDVAQALPPAAPETFPSGDGRRSRRMVTPLGARRSRRFLAPEPAALELKPPARRIGRQAMEALTHPPVTCRCGMLTKLETEASAMTRTIELPFPEELLRRVD